MGESKQATEPKAKKLSDEDLQAIQEADLATGRYISGVELHRYKLLGHAKAISAELTAARATIADLLAELEGLLSMVHGECPSLLEDHHQFDSITAAISKAKGPTND